MYHSPRPSLSSTSTHSPFMRSTDSPVSADSRSSGPFSRSASGTPVAQASSPQKAFSDRAANDIGIFEEWFIHGIDIPIKDVVQLQQELDKDPPADTTAQSTATATANTTKSLSPNTGGIFSHSFGYNFWRVELVRSPNARFSPPASPTNAENKNNSGLSLYLISRHKHKENKPVINANIMVGIREPCEQIGQKMTMDGWLWQAWENKCVFTKEHEYWGCHTLPPMQELLENPKIKKLDTFILTVQVQVQHATRETVIPQIPGFHSVPVDLFTGVSQLLDDPSTGDVKITVLEMYTNDNNSDNTIDQSSQSTTPTSSPLDHRQGTEGKATEDNTTKDTFTVRKRILYAHSAILKARCEYFATMLSGNWAEGPQKVFDGDRARTRHNVIIEEYDFRTMYWFLKWIYSNEIKFMDNEDVRSKYNNEFPSGLLREHYHDVIGWEWQIIDLTHIGYDTSRPSSQLSKLSDNVDGQRIPSRSSYHRTKNMTSTPSPLPTSGIPVHINSKGKQTQSRKSEQIEHPNHHVSTSPSVKSTGNGSGATTTCPIPTTPTTGDAIKSSAKLPRTMDPHIHPVVDPLPASALEIYKLAHQYNLTRLCDMALKHIVSILTPTNALSFLLATHLWPDLHEAIKKYTVENYTAVIGNPEFKRCYAEVGEGLWDRGGEVLCEFTTSLVPRLSLS